MSERLWKRQTRPKNSDWIIETVKADIDMSRRSSKSERTASVLWKELGRILALTTRAQAMPWYGRGAMSVGA